MQGGGGMQLHNLQHERADPAHTEITDKLSTGFEPKKWFKIKIIGQFLFYLPPPLFFYI